MLRAGGWIVSGAMKVVVLWCKYLRASKKDDGNAILRGSPQMRLAPQDD